MENLYYKAPKQRHFDEVKEKAIEIWKTYDDSYGYASHKIAKIREIENIRDNFMSMVAMFDSQNQIRLSRLLSKGTRKAVSRRIKAGGTPDVSNFFNINFLKENEK